MTCNAHALASPDHADTHGQAHGLGQRLTSWFQAYGRRRAQRATVFMLQGLDDRVLSDIGIDRSEIESVVYGKPGDRLRIYQSGRA
jgi:uncharacterized protein YjiS (DUF1127 family)